MDNNILGKRIKILRTENGLTQEEFGKPYNIKKSTVSQYESGSSKPDDELKKKIAQDYNVSLDWLMGLTDIRDLLKSADKITKSLNDDPELSEFWNALKDRDDLKLLFKQTRDMTPNDIKKIIRIIKAIEDEEDRNDG
ncbi:helix-turn-helix domain-containing protein [Clostridium tyrobutyricum]|uniref:helix-turn-helix domain-containing protein n=1 Tax=Clostridium tyrobutyricum TaxID=1519 RepID=UPI000B201990|nr:helix-turn-helix transcriptional regulator [Clostridium tyrobutyricum]